MQPLHIRLGIAVRFPRHSDDEDCPACQVDYGCAGDSDFRRDLSATGIARRNRGNLGRGIRENFLPDRPLVRVRVGIESVNGIVFSGNVDQIVVPLPGTAILAA